MALTDQSEAVRRPLTSTILQALQMKKAKLKFRIKYGFNPPPAGTDFVNYGTLIDLILQKNLLSLPGDIVEIGVFLGGGTYTLAKFLKVRMSSKKVEAIDVFDPSFDATVNLRGDPMCAIYSKSLAGRSQYQVFMEVTKGLDNILVRAEDSKTAQPSAAPVCFGFVDGNHNPEYVVNDFYLVWNRLTPGGVVAFHDYGDDLPDVTATIDRLHEKHRTEIAEFSVNDLRHIAILEKRRN